MIRNVLKTLISFRAILVAAAGIPLALAPSAYAQAPDTGTATAGAVIVTGSNIPTAEEVTPSNVDTLTDQDIRRSGQSGDILQVLSRTDPDFTGAGNLGSTNANIASGITYGGSTIAIRGLPALVLLDGRRVADSAAIAAGGAQFTDVQIFPTSLISRVEVLKDGASALYGSEAVGGVVNVFLKTDFTGLEMGFRYGASVESGVAERRAYMIAGVGNETTHVTAAWQYYEIDPLYTRERGYSAGPGKGGVTTTYAGAVRDRVGRDLMVSTFNSPFDNPALAPGSVASLSYTDPAFAGAFNTATDAQVTAFDLSKIPTSTQKQRNTDEYASFTHDIFGKQLEVFGDIMYVNNNNFSQLNGQPLSNGTGVVIPAGGAANPGVLNPFPVQIDSNTLSNPNRLVVANRYQSHPRTFEDSSDFYRILGGLRSQINKDWFAEGAFYYSHYTIDYVNGGLVSAPQLNALIAGNAAGFEHQYLDFFARNPLGIVSPTDPASVPFSQAAFDSIFGNNIRKLDSYQKTFDARITGFPFELPGGGVGVSVGAEYRDEGFKVADSPEIFVGSVPIGIIDVGRGISSYYGEVRVPIVGSEMQVPWIYSLELSAAGRHDHYEGVTQDANVPKLTLRYQPFKDLTIRSTYSNSFVAPTLYQLFGPQSEGFSPTIALGGVTQDQAQVLTGSNPNLLPSTAESYTAGIVYSPSFVPGLTVTADFFKTLQRGIVGTIGAQTILSSVDQLGTASPYVDQVAFNNFPGAAGAHSIGSFATLANPNAVGLLQGNLQSVFYTDLNQNLGAERITGFDFSIRYLWDLHQWGQLELGANAVYFLSQDFKNFPFTDFYTISGVIGDEAFGAFPDYKVTMLAEYRVWNFTLSFDGTYIPGMHNELLGDITTGKADQLAENESYFIADGRLSYEFKRTPQAIAAPMGKDAKDSKGMAAGAPGVATLSWGDKLLDGMRLSVGCNNLFQAGPPTVAGGNSNTNLATYDAYGRFVYFEIAHKF